MAGMSHVRPLEALPNDFVAIASTDSPPFAAMATRFATSWSGAVSPRSATTHALQILRAFSLRYCPAQLGLDDGFVLDSQSKSGAPTPKDAKVICALSGASYSRGCRVYFGPRRRRSQCKCIFVDNGLVRGRVKSEQVRDIFSARVALAVENVVDAAKVSCQLWQPQPTRKKRKIIVQVHEVCEHKQNILPGRVTWTGSSIQTHRVGVVQGPSA